MCEENKRLDFNKGYTENGFAEKVFHVHVRRPGDNDEIIFRDYLNAHADVAKKYEKLKLGLWKKFEHNRDGYTNAKTEFVTKITRQAKKFYQTDLENFLCETKCIDFSHPLIAEKIAELKNKSETEIDYIKNAYEFVRDKITHSWDVRAKVVSKTASEVLQNGTGICWAKSCLLAALLRGNRIPCGITYQKLTRADADASDGYIIHALNTVYITELRKWIRLDARGNKATVNAQFSTEKRAACVSGSSGFK